MYRQYLHKLNLFLYGTGMIVLGIIILVQGDFLLKPACLIGGIVILVTGVHQIANFISKKGIEVKGKIKLPSLANGIINVGIGLVTIFVPAITVGLLMFIFSLYVLLNALVKIIDFYIFYHNGIKGIAFDFVSFLFFLTFGIIMMFSAYYDQRTLLVISGIYCILYGVTEINDFIHSIIPNKAKSMLSRKIRISLPLFISTFVPLRILKEYQQKLDSREIDIDKLIAEEKLEKNDNNPPDIEVLVHISDDGVGIMGHCDLYFEGEVLSYGNYDEHSARLMGGLGDGVFFTADKDKYIDFSIKNDNKMIFGYGLRLTAEQVSKIREEVRKLKSNIYSWKAPYHVALEGNPDAKLEDFTDYGSKLWNGTHCNFYKFYSGRFKSYFVMSTNCVLLADSILSKAGTDIVKIVGIITPGAYYDYLQREYQLSDSIVISRTIYSKYDKKRFGDDETAEIGNVDENDIKDTKK